MRGVAVPLCSRAEAADSGWNRRSRLALRPLLRARFQPRVRGSGDAVRTSLQASCFSDLTTTSRDGAQTALYVTYKREETL